MLVSHTRGGRELLIGEKTFNMVFDLRFDFFPVCRDTTLVFDTTDKGMVLAIVE